MGSRSCRRRALKRLTGLELQNNRRSKDLFLQTIKLLQRLFRRPSSLLDHGKPFSPEHDWRPHENELARGFSTYLGMV